jgi:hypothetical protein
MNSSVKENILEALAIKENKYNSACIDGKIHEFEFLEKVRVKTCLRTHEISKCLHCKQNYDIIMARIRNIYCDNEDEIDADIPICHCHIWRKDGTCGSKLIFEDDKDGNNYGDIPERRNCNALRPQ